MARELDQHNLPGWARPRLASRPAARGGPLVAVSVALLAGLALAAMPAGAAVPGPKKIIEYRGQSFRVPAGWPVYRLAKHPRLCARMDRRAVYVGTPGAAQSCPAHAVGRRRAILIGARPQDEAGAAATARATASAAFTGLGFDACTAPSRGAMNAWLRSTSYRAVGVYIGGTNRACSQPNLTAGWVRNQTASGWHLIPTFVGLQAPTSACSSCAKFGYSNPRKKGVTAANNAVADAAAIGIGPGSPLYYDLEAYTRGASTSQAVLSFLAGWTSRLHARGYVSGVYSSAASGISDLVAAAGSGYLEPDEIWIANWNGKATAYDPYVPNNLWNGHRIRQYRGGHNETHGGVTINIDNDYVAGATVGRSGPSPDDPNGYFASARSPRPGRVAVSGWAYDRNAPTDPVEIVAYVGGKAGRRGARRYQLGLAQLPWPGVASAYPEAGENHGFDTAFLTTKIGRQRVCLYAVNLGVGADRGLGCRTVGIASPVTVSRISSGARRLGLTVRCRWPARTRRCSGRITVFSRVKLSPRRRARGVYLARRRFDLPSQGADRFRLRLWRGARGALSSRRIKARLKLTIPGLRVRRSIRVGARNG
jgi:hypothetical protein